MDASTGMPRRRARTPASGASGRRAGPIIGADIPIWDALRGGDAPGAARSLRTLGYNAEVPPPLYQATAPGCPDLSRPALRTDRDTTVALTEALNRTFPMPAVDETVEFTRAQPFRTAFSAIPRALPPAELGRKRKKQPSRHVGPDRSLQAEDGGVADDNLSGGGSGSRAEEGTLVASEPSQSRIAPAHDDVFAASTVEHETLGRVLLLDDGVENVHRFVAFGPIPRAASTPLRFVAPATTAGGSHSRRSGSGKRGTAKPPPIAPSFEQDLVRRRAEERRVAEESKRKKTRSSLHSSHGKEPLYVEMERQWVAQDAKIFAGDVAGRQRRKDMQEKRALNRLARLAMEDSERESRRRIAQDARRQRQLLSEELSTQTEERRLIEAAAEQQRRAKQQEALRQMQLVQAAEQLLARQRAVRERAEWLVELDRTKITRAENQNRARLVQLASESESRAKRRENARIEAESIVSGTASPSSPKSAVASPKNRMSGSPQQPADGIEASPAATKMTPPLRSSDAAHQEQSTLSAEGDSAAHASADTTGESSRAPAASPDSAANRDDGAMAEGGTRRESSSTDHEVDTAPKLTRPPSEVSDAATLEDPNSSTLRSEADNAADRDTTAVFFSAAHRADACAVDLRCPAVSVDCPSDGSDAVLVDVNFGSALQQARVQCNDEACRGKAEQSSGDPAVCATEGFWSRQAPTGTTIMSVVTLSMERTPTANDQWVHDDVTGAAEDGNEISTAFRWNGSGRSCLEAALAALTAAQGKIDCQVTTRRRVHVAVSCTVTCDGDGQSATIECDGTMTVAPRLPLLRFTGCSTPQVLTLREAEDEGEEDAVLSIAVDDDDGDVGANDEDSATIDGASSCGDLAEPAQHLRTLVVPIVGEPMSEPVVSVKSMLRRPIQPFPEGSLQILKTKQVARDFGRCRVEASLAAYPQEVWLFAGRDGGILQATRAADGASHLELVVIAAKNDARHTVATLRVERDCSTNTHTLVLVVDLSSASGLFARSQAAGSETALRSVLVTPGLVIEAALAAVRRTVDSVTLAPNEVEQLPARITATALSGTPSPIDAAANVAIAGSSEERPIVVPAASWRRPIPARVGAHVTRVFLGSRLELPQGADIPAGSTVTLSALPSLPAPTRVTCDFKFAPGPEGAAAVAVSDAYIRDTARKRRVGLWKADSRSGQCSVTVIEPVSTTLFTAILNAIGVVFSAEAWEPWADIESNVKFGAFDVTCNIELAEPAPQRGALTASRRRPSTLSKQRPGSAVPARPQPLSAASLQTAPAKIAATQVLRCQMVLRPPLCAGGQRAGEPFAVRVVGTSSDTCAPGLRVTSLANAVQGARGVITIAIRTRASDGAQPRCTIPPAHFRRDGVETLLVGADRSTVLGTVDLARAVSSSAAMKKAHEEAGSTLLTVTLADASKLGQALRFVEVTAQTPGVSSFDLVVRETTPPEAGGAPVDTFLHCSTFDLLAYKTSPFPAILLPHRNLEYRQGSRAAAAGYALLPEVRAVLPPGSSAPSCDVAVELTAGGFGDGHDQLEWVRPGADALYDNAPFVTLEKSTGLLRLGSATTNGVAIGKLDEANSSPSSMAFQVLGREPNTPVSEADVSAVLACIGYRNADPRLRSGARTFTIRVSFGREEPFRCRVSVNALPFVFSIPTFSAKVPCTSGATLLSVCPKLVVSTPDAALPCASVFVRGTTGWCAEEDMLTLIPQSGAAAGSANLPGGPQPASPAAPAAATTSNQPAEFEVTTDAATGGIALSAPGAPDAVIATGDIIDNRTLVLEFPSRAVTGRVLQAILRSVGYTNSGAALSPAARGFEFFVEDPEDGSVCTGTITVAVRVPELPAHIDLSGAAPAAAAAVPPPATPSAASTSALTGVTPQTPASTRHGKPLSLQASPASGAPPNALVYPLDRTQPPAVLFVAPSVVVHTRVVGGSDAAASPSGHPDTHRPILRVEFLHQPVQADTLLLVPNTTADDASMTIGDNSRVFWGRTEIGSVQVRKRDAVVVAFVAGVADEAVAGVMRRIAFRFGTETTQPVFRSGRAARAAAKKVQMSFTPNGHGLWTRVTVPIALE